MLLLIWPGGKVQRILVTAGLAVAKNNRPQSVDRDRDSLAVLECSQKRASAGVERIDFSVSEIAHQQRASKWSECGWRDGHPPGELSGPLESAAFAYSRPYRKCRQNRSLVRLHRRVSGRLAWRKRRIVFRSDLRY